MDIWKLGNASASSVDDVQPDRRGAVSSKRRLPHQERIRPKKIAQREKKRNKQAQKTEFVIIATLNVGSTTGKKLEVVVMIKRKNIGVLCFQETKWKGEKAREIRDGFKLF